MIYTFYSYNGGVGRSNALAGVAEHFYQQGLRVLVLDWDVESPGVRSFFPERVDAPTEGSKADAVSRDVAKARPGLFDMLAEYRRSFAAMPAADDETRAAQGSSEPRETPKTSSTDDAFEVPAAADERTPALVPYLLAVHSSDAADHGGSLHLLPAGLPSQDKTAADFDWDAFYSSYRGKEYFDRLRTQLSKAADVVLVDSPSGVTALGGVCAHLADVVVCFRAKSDENAEIIESMLEHFRSEEFLAARQHRALETIVIRGDGSEANGASAEANGSGSEVNGASTEASEPPEAASSSLAFRLALLAPENHPIRWLVTSAPAATSTVPSTEAAVLSTEADVLSTEAAQEVPQPTDHVDDAGSVAASSSLTTHEVFDEIRKELEATPEPPASSDPFAALGSAWSSVEEPSVEKASVEKASGETLLGEVPSAASRQDESKAPILEAPPLGAFSEAPIAAEAPIATDASPSDAAAKSPGDTEVAPAGSGARGEAKPDRERDEATPDHGADEPRVEEQRAATERRLREKSSALPATELAPRPPVLESSPPVVRSRPAPPRQSAAWGWSAALRRPAVWGWPAAVLSVAAMGIIFDLATRGHGDAHPASSPTREVALSPTADKGPPTPMASAPPAVTPPPAEEKATGKPTAAPPGAQRDEPSGSSGLYLRVGFGRSCTRIVNYRNQFLAAGMSNARAVQLKSRKCALVLGPYPADIVERRRAEHNARHIRGFDNATVVDDGDFVEWL